MTLKLKRETVQRFHCPRCAAGPGEPCRREHGGSRKSNHLPRIEKARALIGNRLDLNGE